MKKQNGITMITLIITIIVMVILAGVAMTAVVGDDSVVTKAKSATENTRGADIKEHVTRAAAANAISENLSGPMKTIEDVLDELIAASKITAAERADAEEDNLLTIGNVEIDFSVLLGASSSSEIKIIGKTETSITVKAMGSGLTNYQFSIDGTNWSSSQSSPEYTFSGLTSVKVNELNYLSNTGNTYTIHAKAKDSGTGETKAYTPITASTNVIVEPKFMAFEYEDLGTEICITGYKKSGFSGIDAQNKNELLSIISGPRLIPSYINGKPVTKITTEALLERKNDASNLNVNSSITGYVYAYHSNSSTAATNNANFMYNQVVTATGSGVQGTYTPVKYFPNDESAKLDLYAIVGNYWGTFSWDGTIAKNPIEFNMTYNNKEWVLPPTITTIVSSSSLAKTDGLYTAKMQKRNLLAGLTSVKIIFTLGTPGESAGNTLNVRALGKESASQINGYNLLGSYTISKFSN